MDRALDGLLVKVGGEAVGGGWPASTAEVLRALIMPLSLREQSL